MRRVAALTLPEAVLLCHAMVAKTANDMGIDVLFFKGPISTALGLRPPHESTDVDAFVRLPDVPKFGAILESAGWLRRPMEANLEAFPSVTTTYFHPHWPCDIDLHISYLGFEGTPDSVFDALWVGHETTTIAGYPITTLSYSGHALTTALHSLRSPARTRSVQELRQVIASMDPEDRSPVIDLARAVGGLAAAKPFIEDAFGPQNDIEYGTPSHTWLLVSSASVSGSAQLMSLIEAPWRRKLAIAWSTLFPSRESLRAKNIRQDLSFSGITRTYVHRARLGFRSLPSALLVAKDFWMRRR